MASASMMAAMAVVHEAASAMVMMAPAFWTRVAVLAAPWAKGVEAANARLILRVPTSHARKAFFVTTDIVASPPVAQTHPWVRTPRPSARAHRLPSAAQLLQLVPEKRAGLNQLINPPPTGVAVPRQRLHSHRSKLSLSSSFFSDYLPVSEPQ